MDNEIEEIINERYKDKGQAVFIRAIIVFIGAIITNLLPILLAIVFLAIILLQ